MATKPKHEEAEIVHGQKKTGIQFLDLQRKYKITGSIMTPMAFIFLIFA